MPYIESVDTPLSGLPLIDFAIERYQPTHIFGLFSGGHDSLTATHVASQHSGFTGVVHIDTGIGVDATREFVRKTCRKHGWPLKVYLAKDLGQDYDQMVIEHGFPGPSMHNKMYNRLKERCLRRVISDHKRKRHDKIFLLSGCRSQESQRRMGHVVPIQRNRTTVWVAINHDWTKNQVNEYLVEHNLDRNPVVDLLCMSGECLCGAYASEGELNLLNQFDLTRPAYLRICELQEKVKAAGYPWNWDQMPPSWWKDQSRGQGLLFKEMPLCHSCVNKMAQKKGDTV